MHVESGPAKTDRNWHLARSALFVGFAAWFLIDGAVRWPAQNREAAEQAIRKLGWEGVTYDKLPDHPTQTDFENLFRNKAQPTVEQVRAALGPPLRKDGPLEIFASKYGYAKLRFGTEPSVDQPFRKWEGGKSIEEIKAQFLWALIPAVAALPFLRLLFKAITLRVVVDDEGLTYAKQRIAFADMTALKDYNPKGWIDLHYRAGARERKLRLDNEKVARFDEIVDAVCAAKGFTNEVRAYAAEQAESAAEADAARAAEDELDREEK